MKAKDHFSWQSPPFFPPSDTDRTWAADSNLACTGELKIICHVIFFKRIEKEDYGIRRRDKLRLKKPVYTTQTCAGNLNMCTILYKRRIQTSKRDPWTSNEAGTNVSILTKILLFLAKTAVVYLYRCYWLNEDTHIEIWASSNASTMFTTSHRMEPG
jgi:hypothetical protein